MTNKITNAYQALTVGLALAITSRTEDRFHKAIALSAALASRLTHEEVEQATVEAQRLVADWDSQAGDPFRN